MRSPLLFLLLMTGCPNAGKDADTAGTGDDTGNPDIGPSVTGCITIDGEGAYGLIDEAIRDANDGSVIALCDGTYTEAVVVDKGVTIQGASADGVIIAGPGTDIPLTIQAAGVTIENVVVNGAREGIELSDADATLTGVTVGMSGSWAIASTDSTVVISGATLTEPAAGGVSISGGDVSIDTTTFDAPGGYAVDISDGANVTLTDNVVTGVVMLSSDVSDGYDVQIDSSTLAMSGNTMTADGMGIAATDSDITMSGDTLADIGYLGIYATDTTFDIDQLSITGVYLQGIYAVGSSFAMTGSTVSVDPEASCDLAYDEWNVSPNGPWCGGMLVVADTIDLTDVSVSGYNDYGMYLVPDTADAAAVTVTGGTIDNVGRWGAEFVASTGTVSGLTVSNMREPEFTDPCSGYLNQSDALLADTSDLAFDGLTLQSNVGWGAVSIFGTSDVTASTFDSTGCSAFLNYQGAATVDGSSFSNGTQYGGLYDSAGVLVATGNTFTNNHSGYSYEYSDGTSTYRTEYDTGYGQDILSFDSGALQIVGNTFSDGDAGIYASGSAGIEVTGNTWTGYDSSIFYVYQADDRVTFSGNSVDDSRGPVVDDVYADVTVDNVTVGTTRASSETYSYYVDDVLQYSYEQSSTYAVFYAQGYYYDDGSSVTELPGSMSVRDVTVASSADSLISISDASVEVDNVEAGSVGSYALYGYWSSYAPDLDVEGLTVESVAGSGGYFYNSDPDDAGAVSLTDVDFGTIGSTGLYANALGRLTLQDVSLGDVAGTGMQTASRTYDYSYYYDAGSGSYVFTYTDIDADTRISATNLTIASTGSTGLDLTGGSAAFTGLALGSAAGTGLSAQGLTALTVTDSVIGAGSGDAIDAIDTYDYYSYESSTTLTSDADTVATVTGTTATSLYGTGMSFEGGAVTLSGNTASGDGASGLDLVGTTADVQGNTFTSNAEYGMTCATVTFTTCATNDLTGNVLGTHLDCQDSCGE